ncbi:MAG: hypothetical protein JWO06_2559, partial [Bacteroidota bacterium]|nr:hypothetical protein [Bacteroidota bacterium]
MQKNLLIVILTVLAIAANSQCNTNVDFSTWTQGGQPANGNWQVQSGGSVVHQTVNGDPTFFYSPFNLMNVHVTGQFKTTDSDDDWMGFVFSFLNPLIATDSFDCWLFDWKQHQQNGASSGKSLDRVNGIIPSGNYNNIFWNHQNTPEFTVIQNTFGGAGWTTNFNHTFDLYLTYTRAVIYVDGVPTFDWHDCYKPGRFGFYNYSQKDCYYSNFQYSLYVNFTLSSVQTCLGNSVDLNFVNNTCTTSNSLNQYASLTWNFGDGTPPVTVNNPTLLTANATHTYAAAGVYTATLTVTDNNGCSATASNTVDVRNPITLSPTLTPPPCNGGSNGSVSVAPTGGFGNYTYSWNGGTQITQTYIGATAGTYTVTVTDGICTASGQYTLNQPTALSATTSHTDASCGLANGSCTMVISGGTPPYSNQSWAGFAGTTVTGLWPGTYIADFEDSHGCSALLQYTETVGSLPCGLTSSATTTNVTCFNGNNGTATLTVTGGTGTQVINWSSGGSGPTATGLTAGTYTYNYSDGNPAHAFSGTVTITQPGAAMVAQLTAIGITCAGVNDGQALASVISGGSPPYTYTWSGGQPNSPSVSNLSPGGISVTITDATGCTATATANISGVPSLGLTFTTIIDSCYHSGKGSATVHVTGGSPVYTYSWNNFSTDTTDHNLFAGNYTITVTDHNGCTVTGTTTVNGPAVGLTRSFTDQYISCHGAATGNFNITASGGTPGYTYTWNPSNVTGSNPTGLVAGIYSFTVTDQYNCTAIGTDTLTEPATAFTATSSHSNVSCNGGSDGKLIITVGGGIPPYTYLGNAIPAGTDTLSGFTAATYTGVVQDSNGCAVTLTEIITQPGPQSVTVNGTNDICYGATQGTATANFVNATGTVTYNWTGGLNGPTISNLAASTYIVTATDQNGCT